MSKKARFTRSFGLFLFSILIVFGFRWSLYEPFVIPSGSMIPTLFVNDHIIVSKSAFGFRYPFTNKWLRPPKLPQRGEVVVFRSVERDDFFMIKRVVGLPGDKIQFTEEGELLVNGTKVPSEKLNILPAWSDIDLGAPLNQFQIKKEKLGEHEHYLMLETGAFRYVENGRVVPEGKIFLMGDNRDRSRDSRFWGELPVENLLGSARIVWLSCEKTISNTNFICDPRFIRWQRIFHRIE
jgi:signal peptidase I